MTKIKPSAVALAIAFALAAPVTASAQVPMASVDSNKDGMVSKQEFLDAMGRQYDETMANLKKMPAAEQGKMMKGTQLTDEGLAQMMRDAFGGR